MRVLVLSVKAGGMTEADKESHACTRHFRVNLDFHLHC